MLPYEHSFILIEDEELWANDQFLTLENKTNFIVNGKLVLDDDLTEAALKESVAAIDILEEVEVLDKKQKSMLQPFLRLNSGSVKEAGNNNQSSSYLKNVGQLSL